MQFIKRINEVFRFRIIKDIIYYYESDSTFLNIYYLNNDYLEKRDLKFKLKDIFYISNNLLLTDDRNNAYFLKDNFFQKIEGFNISSISESLGIAISTDWINYYPIDVEHSVFDVSSLTLFWKTKMSNLNITNGLLYTTIKNGFINWSIQNGDELWQYTLPEGDFDWESNLYINNPTHHKAEIRKLLGVFDGILWISLNSGRLLGLEVETGSLRYNLYEINHYDSDKAIFAQHFGNEPLLNPDWGLFFGRYMQFDAERGILFGLLNYYYYEIDFRRPTESFTVYDASESFEKWSIEADMACVDCSYNGNEIYFGGILHRLNNLTNNIGIFDRNKKEVTWAGNVKSAEGEALNLKKIEYSSGKVYVLDSLSTLHIFER